MAKPRIEELFRTAIVHHQSGRKAEAEKSYRQVLTLDPDHVDCLYYLGLLLAEAGATPAAIELIGRSVALRPEQTEAHYHLGNLYLSETKLEIAAEHYRRAVVLAPNHFRALNNLATACRKMGRLDDAVANYRLALGHMPNNAEIRHNLGIALQARGDAEDAITEFRRAATLKPNFADAHTNLGVALRTQGRLGEAVEHFRKVVMLTPDVAEAHSNLGGALEALGNSDEAMASLQHGRELDPASPRTRGTLADALTKQGKHEEAIAIYRALLAEQPYLMSAHYGLSEALTRLVPGWHVAMMNDMPRNDAYSAALQAAVTPNMHVLEIGTGSGLLAMMAARAGAAHVTSCEAVVAIATTAQGIVADNGFADRITVLPKRSTDLAIGVDMRAPADLLVSEILSNDFVGEGVLTAIEDAKRRLIKPGARQIPSAGSVMVSLIGGEDIRRNLRVDEVAGFNLRRFNGITPRVLTSLRTDLDLEFLTAEAEAFHFDFETADHYPAETKILHVPVERPGRCYGVIQWNRLHLGDGIIFENHPAAKNRATAWQHCIYVLDNPVDLTLGQTVKLKAMHNRVATWFFLEESH